MGELVDDFFNAGGEIPKGKDIFLDGEESDFAV